MYVQDLMFDGQFEKAQSFIPRVLSSKGYSDTESQAFFSEKYLYCYIELKNIYKRYRFLKSLSSDLWSQPRIIFIEADLLASNQISHSYDLYLRYISSLYVLTASSRDYHYKRFNVHAWEIVGRIKTVEKKKEAIQFLKNFGKEYSSVKEKSIMERLIMYLMLIISGMILWGIRLIDSGNASADGVMRIIVDPVNDLPLFSHVPVVIDEDTSGLIDRNLIETTYIEDEPSQLRHSLISLPANGVLIINSQLIFKVKLK